MCGIMGFYCFGNSKPNKDKISTMFSLLESRGKDASGFSFVKQDGTLFVHKAPVKSSEMIKSEEWARLTLPPIMIMHTRMKTQGCQTNNMNNHPLFNKNGIAIVHNGMIMNDKEILANKKRDGEVDSEAILALLNIKKGDRIRRLFDRIEGCFAVASIETSNPDRLILIKKDNPIDLYYDSKDDILYFCSERSIMKEALEITSELKRGFTLGEGVYHFYEMANNHALVINKNGVESYKKYYSRRSYSRDWFNYPSLKDSSQIECPWCMSFTYYDSGRLRNECEWCGMQISSEDLDVL